MLYILWLPKTPPPTVVNLTHILRSMSKGTSQMQILRSTSVYDYGGYV